MHKSQVFFWLLASFLLGIFFASVFGIGQIFIYLGLVAAFGLIAVFGYQKSFNKKGLWAGFLLVTFLFGVVRFNSADFRQDRLDVFTGLKVDQKSVEVVVNGYIDDEPADRGGRQELIMRAKEVVAGNRTVAVNDRIFVTTGSFPKVKYGDVVSTTGSLEKPVNFSDFDYVSYLKTEGIRAIMFYPTVESSKWNIASSNLSFFERSKVGLYKKIFLLKNKFENAVNKSISEPNAAFINGILLGSRQNIPDSLTEAFNKTGVTHILAISGYNIMIISWAVLTGLIYFFKRRTAFWLSVAVVVLFVILTGASASVVRAAIMGLLLTFASGYGRLYDQKNSIILAGAAMVWLNPYVLVFDIGFQLSFAAVLGLIYLYPRIGARLNKVPEWLGIKEITLMTISAQIAVLPLLIYYFKFFSLISLPANMLVLPFVPAAMFIGFLSGLAGMIFLPLSQIIGWFAWAITTYQIEAVTLFARIF